MFILLGFPFPLTSKALTFPVTRNESGPESELLSALYILIISVLSRRDHTP
jgi:hypothetical protein